MKPVKPTKIILSALALSFLLLGCGHGDASHDHAAHAGPEGPEEHADDLVRLTDEQRGSAGVRVVQATGGEVVEGVELPGALASNADALFHVTPVVSGRVRTVATQLGATIAPGDVLCTLESVALSDAVGAWLEARSVLAARQAARASLAATYAQVLAGQDAAASAAVAVRAEVLEREQDLRDQGAATLRPALEAQRELALAELERKRARLAGENARDLALQELDTAIELERARVTAARGALVALGIEVEALADEERVAALARGELPIRAPAAGIVTDRHVSIGETVEPSSKLFVVEDLSTVWFIAAVFESQLTEVGVGQRARVTLDAFPGEVFEGAVTFLDHHVDERTRTVGLRVQLSNEVLASWDAELPLRPGMYGSVWLETDARDAALVLPEAALVHDGAGDHVFVEVEANTFERREVRVRPAANDVVEVLEGLEPGARVAVEGTFLLESIWGKDTLSGGHAH